MFITEACDIDGNKFEIKQKPQTPLLSEIKLKDWDTNKQPYPCKIIKPDTGEVKDMVFAPKVMPQYRAKLRICEREGCSEQIIRDTILRAYCEKCVKLQKKEAYNRWRRKRADQMREFKPCTGGCGKMMPTWTTFAPANSDSCRSCSAKKMHRKK
jgi:hypothetical protein